MSVPDQFQIVLQNGKSPRIERGFAPPTPNALYLINRVAGSDDFTIAAQLRPHGTPQLVPSQTKTLQVADHTELLTRLFSLLRDLPVQYPGTDDMYGRNTSILHTTGQSAPVGFLGSGAGAACANPTQPTEVQKAQFDEAVVTIEKLATATE